MVTKAQIDLERDRLLSRQQAANLCGLSAARLRQLAVERRGPPTFKFGGSKQSRAYYRQSDLTAWLEARLMRTA